MSPHTDPTNLEPSISRRDFLKRISSVLLASAFMPLGGLGTPWQNKPNPSLPLNWDEDTFTPLVGQNFTVNPGSKDTQVYKLASVTSGLGKIQTRTRNTVNAPTGKCYKLVFQSTDKRPLAQSMRQFDHSQLGQFSLFVVPGSMELKGQKYVAIVNHITGGSTAAAQR